MTISDCVWRTLRADVRLRRYEIKRCSMALYDVRPDLSEQIRGGFARPILCDAFDHRR